MKPALFDPGQHTVATPGALRAFDKNNQGMLPFIQRHLTGDWGELDDHDKKVNNRAVKDGSRILSCYKLNDGTKIWIITDGVINWRTMRRYATTVLLPEEY
jgi:hypothetical protein